MRAGTDEFREPLSAIEKLRFRAQPTPEAAYQKYLEWVTRQRYDPDVELFTGWSRDYLLDLPISPAYFDHMLNVYAGEEYRIVERGDLAMLYFTSTPLVSPLFFRYDRVGWKVDTYQEVVNSREYVGGWATWGLINGSHGYTRFQDLFQDFGGALVRVAGGDNRSLPTADVVKGWAEKVAASAPVRYGAAIFVEPVPVERDAYGYPVVATDTRELMNLLHSRRFAELGDRLRAEHERALADVRYELHVLESYSAFERIDAPTGELLSEWVIAMPRSAEARLALAHHYEELAWDRRGTGFMRDAEPEQVEGMRFFTALALAAADTALQLNPQRFEAHALQIRIFKMLGADADAMRAFARGLAVSPYSYGLRSNLAMMLYPKWGGSYEALDALADEAVAHSEHNPRLAAFRGLVSRARGDAYLIADDYAPAVQHVTDALEQGELWPVLVLRARAYYGLQQYEKALGDVNRAWSLAPQEREVFEMRARILAAMGRSAVVEQRGEFFARAERDYARVYQAAPTTARAAALRYYRACRAAPLSCRQADGS